MIKVACSNFVIIGATPKSVLESWEREGSDTSSCEDPLASIKILFYGTGMTSRPHQSSMSEMSVKPLALGLRVLRFVSNLLNPFCSRCGS